MQINYLKSEAETFDGITSTSVTCITDQRASTVTTYTGENGEMRSYYTVCATFKSMGLSREKVIENRMMYGEVPATEGEYKAIRHTVLSKID